VANLKSAQASLEAAKLNLEYTKIKAPISGKVSRAEITVGNLIESGQSAPILTTVVSSNPIYADFEVDEDAYLQFSHSNNTQSANNIPVMMSLGNDNAISHTGYINSFDNRLNTASGTIRARAVFENQDGKLVPGLFARIKLGDTTKIQAILITDRAVGTDQSKRIVFVVGADNKISYREVKLGSVVEGLRVVREGLKPGEKIVVNGLQRVRPGSEIKPEIVNMDTGQALGGIKEPLPSANTSDIQGKKE
jgi:multidrug efflux system membrane fusion protein